MSAAQPPYEALRAARYRKASRSSGAQHCVMIGAAHGWIGVQDSKEYPATTAQQRTTLGFTKTAFAAFIQSTKDGEFDHST